MLADFQICISVPLISIVKLYGDYTSLFSLAHDISAWAKEWNEDLNEFNNLPFQWILTWTPGKAQDISLSRKLHKVSTS